MVRPPSLWEGCTPRPGSGYASNQERRSEAASASWLIENARDTEPPPKPAPRSWQSRSGRSPAPWRAFAARAVPLPRLLDVLLNPGQAGAVLLQLRLQVGGVFLVLRREVGHQLREIVDPRAQDVQFLGVLLLIRVPLRRERF